MIGRIFVAVAVGVAAVLICILGGALLADLHVEFASTVGHFLQAWAAVIGLLVAILVFFGRPATPTL